MAVTVPRKVLVRVQGCDSISTVSLFLALCMANFSVVLIVTFLPHRIQTAVAGQTRSARPRQKLPLCKHLPRIEGFLPNAAKRLPEKEGKSFAARRSPKYVSAQVHSIKGTNMVRHRSCLLGSLRIDEGGVTHRRSVCSSVFLHPHRPNQHASFLAQGPLSGQQPLLKNWWTVHA